MKKFKLLVIDNQNNDPHSIKEILEANDFEVKISQREAEVPEFLKDEIIDLVFIEIQTPPMNSFSVCRSIKSNSSLHAVPVIFIISPGDLGLIDELFKSGADDYILKPIKDSELLSKLNLHLELKYSKQIARNMNQMLEAKVSQRTNELEDSLNKLVKAKKELEILDTAKTEFLNMISHEIRTPLNGIRGSLALIDRIKLTDDVNRYFSLLDFSVKRLEKFSNTILEASTLRLKGQKSLFFVEIDLEKIIDKALDNCILQFKSKNILIDFQNLSPNSLITGDQKYLLECFAALLENAFKFSPAGEKLEIRIQKEAEDFLKITIADRGEGFSKSSLDNIFDAMSNLNGHFDKNTGMGLHLAKLIIEAHSGTIKVGNLHPTGAIVEIIIPVKH